MTTNKYLEKIASDLAMATQSEKEEVQAIKDYSHRIQEAKDPQLKKAIGHALGEERTHAKLFANVIKEEKAGK